MFDYKKLITYVLEGLAVAITAFVILGNNASKYEIILIAMTAAAVFAILDSFAPKISEGTRRGTGFGVGWNLIGL